ncbi:MAG: ArsA family ATPase [Candidatus Heimdallarchaeota archaeon]|nr:ArsA family ATPase [Candidatus Heimdallarchaeota archaeon]MBY8994934.1 ArsA family ATPase [Candidatus Heimdallarchaeota archaeon]
MSLKEILEKKNLRYLFLGGKGGVGKTISASAIAIELTKHFERVLIVSTDPAHSLSDCFDYDLSGGEPVLIESVEGTLYGMELEAEKGMEQFQQMSAMGMPGMADAGLPGFGVPGGAKEVEFDDEITDDQKSEGPSMAGFDIQDALGMGADLLGSDSVPPGSDEAFAFGKLLELIESSEYDIVVFDTAPTGHTLRLLSLPDYLDSFIGRIIKMRMRFGGFFKSIRGMFGGGGKSDAEDNSLETLESLKKIITKARIELADDTKTEFIPVTIPTLMALYETERLLTTLMDYSIPVEHIIVNQLIPPSKDCPFCAQRFKVQEKMLMTLNQYFGKYDLVEIPMVPQEIRGIEQLTLLAEKLFK